MLTVETGFFTIKHTNKGKPFFLAFVLCVFSFLWTANSVSYSLRGGSKCWLKVQGRSQDFRNKEVPPDDRC